jgi:DTW domain-containing protein YfiP
MRSVVLKPSVRCPRCSLPPRWCVCAAHREIAPPVAIDVLMHPREQFRPSSTGNLIRRVIPGSRQHAWRRERTVEAAEVRLADRELWVLHPHGEPAPRGVAPETVQLLLLDGAWREATTMAQETSRWGRLVALPMSGESRYWLRAQADGGRFSTVEALMFALRHLGLERDADELRLQFELHVYAGLRSRGHKETALRYLADSPIRSAFPELIAQLDVRRPR